VVDPPPDPAESARPRDAHFVQSLERGLSVIRAFDADSPAMTLSDVARRTGMTRAATRRSLLTLVDLGYVRSDGRLFALTPRVLELGYAYLSGAGLPAVAQPHLEALAADVGHTASLAALDGDDVVYLARVAVRRIVSIAITVGTRFPAYATSMGRVLLAARPDDELDEYLDRLDLRPLSSRMIGDAPALRTTLQQVRTAGFCLTDQELETGLRSIAVPVRGAGGEVVAAMNLSVPAGAETAQAMRRGLLPRLRAAADAVEADLRASRGAAR
jgi:IclR family transcriptional regulator, pca regulon regulatory protein